MVSVVNVVASGSLDIELNLEQVAKDLGSKAEYDPQKYPGMCLRFEKDAPLITVYRTGKYIVTGADSEEEEAHKIRERSLNLLADNGMTAEPDDKWFRIQNLVCTAELGESLNLNALAIGLGLESTEYEPEQFPALIYRGGDSVLLVFSSGKIVCTGQTDLNLISSAIDDITEQIEEYTSSNSVLEITSESIQYE